MAQPQRAPFPDMTSVDEDALIHSRLMNDERVLRRLAKRFHAVAQSPASSTAHEKERESLLDDLAAFQSQLATRALVCDAERRQVLHYEAERKRIEEEQEVLRGELVQLKNELEVEQVHRKRKLEYDQIAERVNKLAPRGELEQSIAGLEEEIASIEAQLEVEQRAMASRKTAFDVVVSELQTLRLMGKDDPDEEHDGDLPDVPMGEDGEGEGEADDEREEGDDEDDPRRKRDTAGAADSTKVDEKIDLGAESSAPGTPAPSSLKLNPSARSFKPRQMSELGTSSAPEEQGPEKEDGEQDEQEQEQGLATDGDIEMGEVVEQSQGSTGAPAPGSDEREEGETSPLTPLST
ncbi:hypothetical protein EXIGLDRAFT_764601 [Exidia glandulosa HHB12029]|uniref:Tho complex subunit 7/Mft1p n=1 Tax=Exidia glandulosa HHB12029 TaxID=1314781 RepID=A0A165L3V4_EXIGL|nr:hypothetical protein EXIGLDRAFT_764601 [Exidia glandulosa HHB12029]